MRSGGAWGERNLMFIFGGSARAIVLGLAGWLLAGCGDTMPPVIESIEVANNPNDSAPLVALFSLRASEPVRLRLLLEDGSEPWAARIDSSLARDHTGLLTRLRFDTRYDITAIVTDTAGNETRSDAQRLSIAPYPQDFPTLTLKTSDPARMEPGLTLFNLIRWGANNVPDEDFGALLIVDSGGEVVWFYRAEHNVGDARQLANGNILYGSGRSGVAHEIDLRGDVVERWHAAGTTKDAPPDSIPVDTDTFHHEVAALGSGNLLTVGTEIRGYDGYPTSPADITPRAEPAHLVGDLVVEFSRDGTIVREIKLLDVLDPYRIGSAASFSGAFWQPTYKDVFDGELLDWAHTNSVFYDAADDAFVLSARRQDAVVKVNASTGELVWILGIHDRWNEPWSARLLSPVGALEWPNHQHAVKVTPQRTYLMYDNGSNRENLAADAKPYSRAVEYAVDEEAMTVREVWSYGGRSGERFFSSFISDADWLPHTGNVLITDGGRIRDESGDDATEFEGHRWARLVEVTHAMPAEVVFELIVDDETGRWHVYRADRINDLHVE